ncbi:MAG: isomerizing glutamine--fructose-6-phosphate transaminase, partial [Candidatus Hydrogenedentota bacterium]
GMLGKLYLEQYSRVYTDADYSSEFRYRNPVANGDALVIGISQSGETGDTLAGLHEAKAKFLPVLSFLNNLHSTMARESDAIIDLMAGPEIGVASTKAYTAEVMSLFLFSLYMSAIKWILPREERQRILEEVKSIPEKMEKVLKNTEKVQEVAEFLKTHNDTIFLGRTFNYPSALEGALKLKEISYIHASGYAGGEFKHGPIALVSEDVPVVVIVPKGEIHRKMISNLEEVKARKGKIISIITEGDEEVKSLSDYWLEIPETSEALSPLLTAIPMQLLAYYTALYRGCDVDQPRNLAKSVTVE